MRGLRDHLGGLTKLHLQATADERRAMWRQGMATLAAAVETQHPVPLEGFDPLSVQRSVASAIGDRLLDDLDFLSPEAGHASLYELASVLPPGNEKRFIGRRVAQALQDGNALTFIALATQLALTSKRALSGMRNRSRVALCLDLPFAATGRANGLALALISRRESEREWLSAPSMGSLPSRRLAARLLERAAHEAARRARQGDESGVRVFELDSVQAAWNRLLGDRESLVWRHVASARGLLSGAVPRFQDEIERHLTPRMTPTEWRRAAASLTSAVTVTPDHAIPALRRLLKSEVAQKDPGIAGAMLLSLPRAASTEPDAAQEFLGHLASLGGLLSAEALVEVRREQVQEGFGASAAHVLRTQLNAMTQQGGVEDDGVIALQQALYDELRDPSERAPTLPERLDAALRTYLEHDARQAFDVAQTVLGELQSRFATLETESAQARDGRVTAFRCLREIEQALLERSTVFDLLVLGEKKDTDEQALTAVGTLFERLTNWVVAHERTALTDARVDHLTLRMRRMRTMLHLVDADGNYGDDRSFALRERRHRTAQVLLGRAQFDAPSPLRRVVCASASRACDALVRDELGEVSDVLIAAGTHLASEDDLRVFSEASMVPEVKSAVAAYAGLSRVLQKAEGRVDGAVTILEGLLHLAHDLPIASTPRVEALRSSLLQVAQALEPIAMAGSLAELSSDPDGSLFAELEQAVQALSQLVIGARRRLRHPYDFDQSRAGVAIKRIDFAVDNATTGKADDLEGALEGCLLILRAELPIYFADAIHAVLQRVQALPAVGTMRPREGVQFAPKKEAPLPVWLPPARNLGGYYVLRTLGSGAVGSVFVARRFEERHNTHAERFALKVPEYGGDAARTLSEAEFMTLFRAEAGALLSLPRHPNIAHFVTFDAGARPKPILVMELVEGPTLERVLQMGAMDVPRAFEILDGIAAGLEAMHQAGIGHLDVKPTNVILRPNTSVSSTDVGQSQPVLVDFGLAGRHVRPGCATGEYGAPEIWGTITSETKPMPADVYAFGCLAYELLTGQTLFSAPNEVALITAHVTHDGLPPGISALAARPETRDLSEVLFNSLRSAPRSRLTMSALRAQLVGVRSRMSGLSWPLVSQPT